MKSIKIDNKNITPSKVICVGRNYTEHIKELNNEVSKEIVIFNKPNSAITNELCFFSDDTRFESEICFLIIDNKIYAVGFGLDLTKANIQNKLKKAMLPWERAKSFNGSAVFSGFVKFKGNVKDLKLELFVNNNLTQIASINLMINKPQEIINDINSFMKIEDGDIIMTGTPKGVGTYRIGDVFTGKIYLKKNLIIEEKWKVSKNKL